MGKTTYKDIFQLVDNQIQKRLQFQNTKTFRNQLDRTDVGPLFGNSVSDVRSADIVRAVQDILSEALPGAITEGLEVTQTSPVSGNVIVKAGKGSKGGALYNLDEDTTLVIPFDLTTEVFFIHLFRDRLMIDKEENKASLLLAKIIVPDPSRIYEYGNWKIYNRKDDREDELQPYIAGYKPVKLYADANGDFEEDTIELLRANIGPVLADNIIGNIRLSENLKISNTQGTVELDSRSMKIFNEDGGITAKFNKDGTFYYNSDGIEIARFATDSARIGNILITKNSIQSNDFISENKGFKIQDDGYAEFENVRIRGRISSSVFEYDKISAVGGKLFVGNSSVIATDMSALDSATITVEDSLFSIGDVLRIKDGLNEEYMQVTGVGSAPTYNVTRDLANAYSSDNNPTWAKGTAIVSTGNPNSGQIGGFIVLDSVSNNSPFIDIAQRNSATATDWSVKARLGNLSGITDAMYGTLSGYGLYSDNVYLKGSLYAPDIKTATSGARIELNTCNLSAYDATQRIFNLCISGAEVGDLCLGDFSGNNGLMWDASASSLCIRGQLNADDLVTGSICADRIGAGYLYLCRGITIATSPSESGSGGPQRTEFDDISIKSYNNVGRLTFEVCNGHIQAEDIRLQDPTCTCCYSFLSGGALQFHDELGNVPYVKRICNGEATTGDWVCLLGWRSAPKVIVSLKSMNSYSAAKVAQDQRWDIYADNITQYCESGMNYGYCFQVHSLLSLASGTAGECVKNAAWGACVCTDLAVCSTKVRSFFQLWCHAAAPGNYYWGTLCYAICYRCLGCLVWCASCFCYAQPHATLLEIQSNSEQTQTLTFPCNAKWEIMLAEVSLTWTDSGIASGSTSCFLCTRSMTSCTACQGNLMQITGGESLYCKCCTYSSCSAVTLAGSSPTSSCIYCAYVCLCWCTVATCHLCNYLCYPGVSSGTDVCLCSDACVGFQLISGSTAVMLDSCVSTKENRHIPGSGAFGCCCCAQVSVTTATSSKCVNIGGTCTQCDFTAGQICLFTRSCIWKDGGNWLATAGICTVENVCLFAGTLYQCYCVVTGASECCVFRCLHSVCDTYGASCILDATGTVNWLAIAYS